MIGRLRGVIAEKGVSHVIIDVGGVGYEVFVPLRALEALPPVGQSATLAIHTHVREDAIVLFGFPTVGDRKIFERLTSVQGVGPKLALAALGHYSGSELQSAILRGDVKALTRVSGVGPKTAQRVVLELASRIGAIDMGDAPAGSDAARRSASTGALDDLRTGLIDLGYSLKQADTLCERLRPRAESGLPIEGLLTEALALIRSGQDR